MYVFMWMSICVCLCSFFKLRSLGYVMSLAHIEAVAVGNAQWMMNSGPAAKHAYFQQKTFFLRKFHSLF